MNGVRVAGWDDSEVAFTLEVGSFRSTQKNNRARPARAQYSLQLWAENFVRPRPAPDEAVAFWRPPPNSADPKPRREVFLVERFVRVQLHRPLQQRLLSLGVVWVRHAAVYWAHGGALLFVVVANALGAARGVNHVDVVAFADGLVGALGLAGTTVDALFADHGGHSVSPWAVSTADRPAGLSSA